MDIFERIKTSKAKHWRPETPAEGIVWLLFQLGRSEWNSSTWEQALSYEFGDKFKNEVKEWFNTVSSRNENDCDNIDIVSGD